MRRQLSDDERATVARLAAAGEGPTAIARALGRPVSNISATYRRLQAEGLAPRGVGVKGPPWTPAARQKLLDLIEQGHPYDVIARRLQRSRTAIILKARRLGVRITTTKATMSARDVAKHLGLSCAKPVSRWIALGWLRARNAGTASRPLWRITWDDLTAFLENPAHWLVWNPARIPDLALREWAHEIRAGGERYFTVGELAQRYHVDPGTIGSWIDKGWLPAVRHVNRMVPASALETFVPPCMGGSPDPRWPRDGWQVIGQARGATFRKRAA